MATIDVKRLDHNLEMDDEYDCWVALEADKRRKTPRFRRDEEKKGKRKVQQRGHSLAKELDATAEEPDPISWTLGDPNPYA